MNAKYDKLDNEIRYKKLLKNKQSVIVEHTNYSTQYKIGKSRFILNEKGEQDVFAFHLLNKTRNDAIRYLKKENAPVKERKTEILWSIDTSRNTTCTPPRRSYSSKNCVLSIVLAE